MDKDDTRPVFTSGRKSDEITPQSKSYAEDVGILGVEQVEEHEDGSATYQFQMDAHARGLLAEEGLKLVLYCAAAKMDMQLVYDFIEDHIKYEKDELTEYEFGVNDEKDTSDD